MHSEHIKIDIKCYILEMLLLVENKQKKKPIDKQKPTVDLKM